jgi:putative FmdB family regulatory protein
MPIYSYRCARCHQLEDHVREPKDRNNLAVCPDCGGLAYRAIGEEKPRMLIFETYWDQHLANDDYPKKTTIIYFIILPLKILILICLQGFYWF